MRIILQQGYNEPTTLNDLESHYFIDLWNIALRNGTGMKLTNIKKNKMMLDPIIVDYDDKRKLYSLFDNYIKNQRIYRRKLEGEEILVYSYSTASVPPLCEPLNMSDIIILNKILNIVKGFREFQVELL